VRILPAAESLHLSRREKSYPFQYPVSDGDEIILNIATKRDMPPALGRRFQTGLDRDLLYVFIVLAHDRRRVIHFNVTEHPTAIWAGQQIIEAFPEDRAPQFRVRDRDGIYGEFFEARVEGMSIEESRIAPRSPWQNCYSTGLI